MSTAAGNAGELKNQQNVATHPGLADKSYGNIMPGSFLLFLVPLLSQDIQSLEEAARTEGMQI